MKTEKVDRPPEAQPAGGWPRPKSSVKSVKSVVDSVALREIRVKIDTISEML
jgi:hypothetical protein